RAAPRSTTRCRRPQGDAGSDSHRAQTSARRGTPPDGGRSGAAAGRVAQRRAASSQRARVGAARRVRPRAAGCGCAGIRLPPNGAGRGAVPPALSGHAAAIARSGRPARRPRCRGFDARVAVRDDRRALGAGADSGVGGASPRDRESRHGTRRLHDRVASNARLDRCRVAQLCPAGRGRAISGDLRRRASVSVAHTRCIGGPRVAHPERLRRLRIQRAVPGTRRRSDQGDVMSSSIENLVNREYKFGFVTDIDADTIAAGLGEDTVRAISAKKLEPEWLLEWRLKAYRRWTTMREPHWGNVRYEPISYQDQVYYSAPKTRKPLGSLDEVDPRLRETYDKLGIPLKEQQILAGVAVDAVFDSVSVGTTYREQLAKLGIIFCSLGEAVREHPDLVRKYLGSVVPYSDNFYASLNSAVFSDGSFVYVPPGVRCPMELSTYFRINAANTGQFE